MNEFNLLSKFTPFDIIKFSNSLYDKGFAVKNIIGSLAFIETKIEKDLLILCYHKLKSDFRCERMFFFYILEAIFVCSNEDIKDMLLI